MTDSRTSLVLICSPDPELRNSLVFRVMTEGHLAIGCAYWPSDYAGPIDAVIIDEPGLSPQFQSDVALIAFGSKVILLTSGLGRISYLPNMTVLCKPVIDRALIGALNDALRKERADDSGLPFIT